MGKMHFANTSIGQVDENYYLLIVWPISSPYIWQKEKQQEFLQQAIRVFLKCVLYTRKKTSDRFSRVFNLV